MEDLQALKAKAELTKTQEEVEKLRQEREKLRFESSAAGRRVEFVKALAGVGSLVAALAAIIGLAVSLFQQNRQLALTRTLQQEQVERERAIRTIEEINRGLERLSSENAAKQLAGIASLRLYLSTSGASYHRQLLSSLVGILAVEPKLLIRDAIVSVLEDIDIGFLGPEAAQDVMAALLSRNRTLVGEGNLRDHRISRYEHRPESSSVEARATSLGTAIAVLLRKGIQHRDLAGIYCVRCDFSKLKLPAYRFDDAILYLSDFTGSELRNSSFDRADLDSTRFINADLREARLTVSWQFAPDSGRLETYVERQFANAGKEQLVVVGPDFSCADLRGANFEHHPIFHIGSDEAVLPDVPPLQLGAKLVGYPLLRATTANFAGANLDGTRLESAQMFGGKLRNEVVPFSGGWGSTLTQRGVDLFVRRFAAPKAENDGLVGKSFTSSLDTLRASFSDSNWKAAKLPARLAIWLEQNPPQAMGAQCRRLVRLAAHSASPRATCS